MSALPKRLMAALGVLPLVLVVLAAAPTDAARAWAPEATATITPGVQMYTGDAQCTGNFVFRDRAGHVYVGYAAHCAGRGQDTDTNGCTTPTNPVGTKVDFVTGGNFLFAGTTVGTGRLAYTSWGTMQRLKTRNANRCAYNDFALVRVDRASVWKVNPTVPGFGGRAVSLHCCRQVRRSTRSAARRCADRARRRPETSWPVSVAGWPTRSTPATRGSPETPAAASWTRSAGLPACCRRSTSGSA
ncbi:MAG: hypothetical protein JWR52_3307 [Marmoricola sp.]|nr:hypothetical protein [Marmoricola sp.]